MFSGCNLVSVHEPENVFHGGGAAPEVVCHGMTDTENTTLSFPEELVKV